jgi:hypothetical protein
LSPYLHSRWYGLGFQTSTASRAERAVSQRTRIVLCLLSLRCLKDPVCIGSKSNEGERKRRSEIVASSV